MIIKVNGRASYLNASPLRDFFGRLIEQGKRRFLIDFQNCSAMDSTVLGIIAGAALDLRSSDPPGQLLLSRLGRRNLELVRNLGLHRLTEIVDEEAFRQATEQGEATTLANNGGPQGDEQARMILQAHENLVAIDEGNRTKFQDVILFLKNQVEQA